MKVLLPEVVHVLVSGPVATGKTLILKRISEVIEGEFGATALLTKPVRSAFNMDQQPASGWETEVVRKTLFVLSEETQPRGE
jgi:nucleoside-triphosphatase THEP1